MNILQALEKNGPMTGRTLFIHTGMDMFDLWRECYTNKDILVKRVSKRYLRFDKNVKGYARLSPAIQREFSTYSVIGLRRDKDAVEEKALELKKRIEEISREKFATAKTALIRGIKNLKEARYIKENACFIIGGDVPLLMAHEDPRPEFSTGMMVSGSDLDIVIVTSNDFSNECLNTLDVAVRDIKYTLLNQPHKKEEIDYIIKPLSKVKSQAEFDTFEHMVACKIIAESKFLFGDMDIYHEILDIMDKNDVPAKLKLKEIEAIKNRDFAWNYLLEKGTMSRSEYIRLFTTTDEFNEIF